MGTWTSTASATRAPRPWAGSASALRLLPPPDRSGRHRGRSQQQDGNATSAESDPDQDRETGQRDGGSNPDPDRNARRLRHRLGLGLGFGDRLRLRHWLGFGRRMELDPTTQAVHRVRRIRFAAGAARFTAEHHTASGTWSPAKARVEHARSSRAALSLDLVISDVVRECPEQRVIAAGAELRSRLLDVVEIGRGPTPRALNAQCHARRRRRGVVTDASSSPISSSKLQSVGTSSLTKAKRCSRVTEPAVSTRTTTWR